MKKYRLAKALLLLILLALVLTSCEAHVGNDRFDVKWYVIAIPATVFGAACFVIACVVLSENTYVCPECGKRFRPKWWRAMFSLHYGSDPDRVLKCPHCGHQGFCRKED